MALFPKSMVLKGLVSSSGGGTRSKVLGKRDDLDFYTLFNYQQQHSLISANGQFWMLTGKYT